MTLGIPSVCEAVGLRVLALKRIRIGRVALAKVRKPNSSTNSKLTC